MKNIMPSREVLEWTVKEVERLYAGGEANSVDLADAWMALCIRVVCDQKGHLTRRQRMVCRRLLKHLRKWAEDAGINLEED